MTASFWRRSVPLLLLLIAGGSAFGDVLHLKSGGRLEGKIVSKSATEIVIETKFGRQTIARSQIDRVEEGATPAEQVAKKLAELEKDDAEGHFQLLLECRKQKLREQSEQLLELVLKIDPQHEGANELLGKVLYLGKYVTPQERDRLEKEARAEQMRAQGLVEHEGRFVTPEEKRHLERGLVLREGEWLKEEEAKKLDGFVLVDGKWIHHRVHHVNETRAEIERVVDRPLVVETTDRVVVYTDLDGDFAAKLAERLDQGFVNFAKEFQLGEGLDWVAGERRPDFFVFKSRFDYHKFIEHAGKAPYLGPTWVARARGVVSVYRFQGWAFAATYVANRGPADGAAYCANMMGHLLINTYGYRGAKIPPFFDEAYAALVEFELLGRNRVFTVGEGRYERQLSDDDLAFFEDGDWLEALARVAKSKGDTPLIHVIRRHYGDMSQMDVAKGMAMYQRWRIQGDGRVKEFFDALRKHWPGDDPEPGHARALQAMTAAFHDQEGKDIPVIDQELRDFVIRRAN